MTTITYGTAAPTTILNNSIWRDTLQQIDGWDRRATAKYNKDNQDNLVSWVCPTTSVHVQGLAWIGVTQSLLRGEGHYDRHPYLAWSIVDLYRGITLSSLAQEWSRLFFSSVSVARKIIHQSVGYLDRQATELIWKPRCKETIERERELDITPKLKRVPYIGQRGDWSDGYGYILQRANALAAHYNMTTMAVDSMTPHWIQQMRAGRCSVACLESGNGQLWRGWEGYPFCNVMFSAT